MKSAPPTDEQLNDFEGMKLGFIVCLILAGGLWWGGGFAALLAVREMTTTTVLRTTAERNDARVLQAFAEARAATGARATLLPCPDPKQETRDATLTVIAPTKHEALAGRAAMTQAMQSAFTRENAGPLYDIGNAPYATPIPNANSVLITRVFAGLAVLVVLFAVGWLILKWRRSHLPPLALVGIGLTVVTFLFVTGAGGGMTTVGVLLFGLPIALVGALGYLSWRVWRARSWPQAQGVIIDSKAAAQRSRFAGERTNLRNMPKVSYAFNAPDGRRIENDRISLGYGSVDAVDTVLRHYAKDALVPVFYNPADPTDCVLERDPPVNLGCLWGGIAAGLAVYAGILWIFFQKATLPELLAPAWHKLAPGLHHPGGVFCAGGFGLFCLGSALWNYLHPTTPKIWTRTRATIASSEVESFRELGASSASHRDLFRALIEYRYQAEGREYSGLVGDGLVTVSSSSRAEADAATAKYPAGSELDVYYNPQAPSQSSLTEANGLAFNGGCSLIVGCAMVALAVYLAMR